MEQICLVNYASQPDIQFFCDDSWSIPAWNQPKDLPQDIYLADNKSYYTFEFKHVTCTKCLAKRNMQILVATTEHE